jgi:hypothetical protein
MYTSINSVYRRTEMKWFIITLLVSSCAFAQQSIEVATKFKNKRMAELNVKYNNSAVKILKEHYGVLHKLKAKYMKESDLEAAVKVDAEMKKIHGLIKHTLPKPKVVGDPNNIDIDPDKVVAGAWQQQAKGHQIIVLYTDGTIKWVSNISGKWTVLKDGKIHLSITGGLKHNRTYVLTEKDGKLMLTNGTSTLQGVHMHDWVKLL